MTNALLVAPALLLGGVLIASGALKLRTPADLDEFRQLGVPAVLQRDWIARAHPWGEIALGVALVILGGWLGAVAAVLACALMATYLVLVVRARAATPDASCACFGSTRPITSVTVVRNAWFTLLALTAVATTWALPMWGGAVAALGAQGWPWVAIAAGAAVTVALILWPEPLAPTSAAVPVASTDGDGELDYVRAITPAVPVQLADGSVKTLRELAGRRPMLLLAVSPTCASCVDTIESRATWRALLPEVDIRLIVGQAAGDSELVEHEEPVSLHDPELWVSQSLGYEITPSATLFGIDGLLAGGPVTGSENIRTFVGDIYESLHGLRPDGH